MDDARAEKGAAGSAPLRSPTPHDSARCMLVQRAAEDGGDGAHLADEAVEFVWENRLRAVGERVSRVVVNFDEDSVGADGDCRAR